MSERITSASKSARTSRLKDLRTRILILIAVIAVFVIILFLISILFSGSDLAHNFSIYAFSVKSSVLGLNIQPASRIAFVMFRAQSIGQLGLLPCNCHIFFRYTSLIPLVIIIGLCQQHTCY